MVVPPRQSQDKNTLRQEMRARRRAITAGDAAAGGLAAHFVDLLGLPEVGGKLPLAAVVAGYEPLPDEIDPRPLLGLLRRRGLIIALPVTTSRKNPLTFRRVDADTPMQKSAFGIMEPVSGEKVIPDVVIVPLLAFDRHCHRLGFGAGHYDRTLADLRAAGPVLAIGVAFAEQYIDGDLPVDAHDEALDCVVTDQGIYWPA